jgi:hypothetical protein
VIHFPAALLWHDRLVQAHKATSHRILACCVTVVVWPWRLASGAGVVVVDVVPAAAAILVVRKHALRVLLHASIVYSSALPKLRLAA